MSKNKFAKVSGIAAVAGENKQRNHTKSGKKAARKEQRRTDAIGRQERRIKLLESRLSKVNHKDDHIRKIARARVVLKCIEGGTPHHKLWAELKGAHDPKAIVDITAK